MALDSSFNDLSSGSARGTDNESRGVLAWGSYWGSGGERGRPGWGKVSSIDTYVEEAIVAVRDRSPKPAARFYSGDGIERPEVGDELAEASYWSEVKSCDVTSGSVVQNKLCSVARREGGGGQRGASQ